METLPGSKNYQKRDVRRIPRTAASADMLKILHEDGGVIIQNLLSQQQVDQVNLDINGPLQQISPGAKTASERQQNFHGANTKRLTNMVTHSKTWREEVLDDDLIHDLCEKVYKEESGSYWCSTAQVIEIGPGNKAQDLHHDFGNMPPYWLLGSDGPEAHLNFLIALNETTEESGATRVIPGSHKWDVLDFGHQDLTVPAEMGPGDCLFFNGKVLHGGGANRTADYYRRVVAFTFCPGFLTPEEAHPLILDLDLVKTLPERSQRVLGFRSQHTKYSPLWLNNMQEIGDHLGLTT